MDNFEIDLCVQPCPRVPGRVGGEEQQQRVPALRTPGGAHRTLPHPCNKIVIEKTNIFNRRKELFVEGTNVNTVA